MKLLEEERKLSFQQRRVDQICIEELKAEEKCSNMTRWQKIKEESTKGNGRTN